MLLHIELLKLIRIYKNMIWILMVECFWWSAGFGGLFCIAELTVCVQPAKFCILCY